MGIMEEIILELRAANKNCTANFIEIAKRTYHDSPIFHYAVEYCNASASFRRVGKTLHLLDVTDNSLIIKLISETPLQMASKSLSGFSRRLLSIDKELGEGIFDDLKYNDTLFRSREFPMDDDFLEYEEEDMSDSEALKMCVDVFCTDITMTKEEKKCAENVNKQIKKALFEYKRQKRLNAYANGLNKIVKSKGN